MNIGRNAQCPCGSGKKHKHCCQGKIDWARLQNAPIDVQARFLTLRGKNLMFLATLAAALQLDDSGQPIDWPKLKRAFTPEVVRAMYEMIPEIWPDLSDYERCIRLERESTSGLYTGTYSPDAILRAVARHSLYSTRIVLVDPFLHPYRIRPEYSPVIHPEEHRSNAIQYAFLWLSLAPWIFAGLVSFIRMPGDFDSGVMHEVLEIQDARLKEHPELEMALNEEVTTQVEKMSALDRGFEEYMLLSHPDQALLEIFADTFGSSGSPFRNADEFLQFINRRREQHPYYVERLPGQTTELTMQTSGACYEMAKRICAIGDFHLITDMRFRWLELQSDYDAVRGNLKNWSPFSKALQAANLKVLDKVPLSAALQLRRENRLESMRLFLRKVWTDSRESELFAEENAVALASELDEKIRESEADYKKIDRELLAILGASVGGFFATSSVGFIPAASAALVANTVGLIRSQWQRRSFQTQFPAGFFLNIKKH